MTSKETRDVDGTDVPVVKLEISSVSHPFWTGKMREAAADGKVDRFNKRYGSRKKAAKPAAEASDSSETPEASDTPEA